MNRLSGEFDPSNPSGRSQNTLAHLVGRQISSDLDGYFFEGFAKNYWSLSVRFLLA